jgi:hypothetical protein
MLVSSQVAEGNCTHEETVLAGDDLTEALRAGGVEASHTLPSLQGSTDDIEVASPYGLSSSAYSTKTSQKAGTLGVGDMLSELLGHSLRQEVVDLDVGRGANDAGMKSVNVSVEDRPNDLVEDPREGRQNSTSGEALVGVVLHEIGLDLGTPSHDRLPSGSNGVNDAKEAAEGADESLEITAHGEHSAAILDEIGARSELVTADKGNYELRNFESQPDRHLQKRTSSGVSSFLLNTLSRMSQLFAPTPNAEVERDLTSRASLSSAKAVWAKAVTALAFVDNLEASTQSRGPSLSWR